MTFLHTNTSPRKSSKKRIILNIFLVLLIILVGVGLWFSVTVLQAKNKIITANDTGGSILLHTNTVTPTQLTGDTDGRVNILLLGVGGGDHPGAYLTDTIQVLSLDTQNHKAAMLSIPRDLWYKYPDGTYGRINEMYNRGEAIKAGNGPNYSKSTISALLGIPINYYALIDFQGFVQMVNTLGGITVDVDQPLDDCNYPNDIDVQDLGSVYIHNNCKTLVGSYIHIHFNTGIQQMNGSQALAYARSRHSTSDFDRSHRQQQVMVAIKEKALTAGILANPLKITQIISILGNHIRTDMQPNDFQALADQVKGLDTSQIITQVIDSSATGPLVSQNINGADVLVPKDGDYTYQAVKDIAHGIFTNPFLVKENSSIAVYNATNQVGLATTVAKTLKALGYNIVTVADNPTQEQFTQLIDYSGGKNPFTISFLEKRFGLKAQQASANSTGQADISLIIGADYHDQGSIATSSSSTTP